MQQTGRATCLPDDTDPPRHRIESPCTSTPSGRNESPPGPQPAPRSPWRPAWPLVPSATAAQATSSAAAVSRCAGSLSIRSTEAAGGDSHGGVVVIFTNAGSATCWVRGYPAATVSDRTGTTVAHATRTLDGYLAGCDCTRPARVRLAPGQSASTVVEGDNGGGDECLQGHTLAVTPPNVAATTALPYLDAYTCRLQVHPLVAGVSGGNRQ